MENGSQLNLFGSGDFPANIDCHDDHDHLEISAPHSLVHLIDTLLFYWSVASGQRKMDGLHDAHDVVHAWPYVQLVLIFSICALPFLSFFGLSHP